MIGVVKRGYSRFVRTTPPTHCHGPPSPPWPRRRRSPAIRGGQSRDLIVDRPRCFQLQRRAIHQSWIRSVIGFRLGVDWCYTPGVSSCPADSAGLGCSTSSEDASDSVLSGSFSDAHGGAFALVVLAFRWPVPPYRVRKLGSDSR